MGYFNVVIVTILFYQCFSQTISSSDDRFQSTQRKHVINSVLDSLINAIHPVEETQNQGGNFPINSNWELSDDQDSEENYNSLTDVITSTDESVEVSEVANESETEDQEIGLPDDDLFREEESETNKHISNIRPLIPSVTLDPNSHQSLIVFKKQTRAPKPSKIRIKPKLNITQLLHIKSTTTQPFNQFSKDYYNSFSSTTLKKKGIEIINFLTSKFPGFFHSTQPAVKPGNGPDIWHKATTSSLYDLPIWTTRTQRTANTLRTNSNTKTTKINDLINVSVSGSPSTISDIDLDNMMGKINLIIDMYNKTTQTNIDSRTIPHLKTNVSSTNLKSTTSSYDNSYDKSTEYNYVSENDELDDKRNDMDDDDYNAKIEMLKDIFQKWKGKKPQPTTQTTEKLEHHDDMAKNSEDLYEPVRLEMPIFVDTNINPIELNNAREHQGFNFDEMISKINARIGKVSSTTLTTPTIITTTPKNEENISRFMSTKSKSSYTSHPTKRPKNGRNSGQTFGPISREHTLTSLIGPMISSTDQTYKPVTLPKIHMSIATKQKLSSTSSSIAPTIITTEGTSAQTTDSVLNLFNLYDSSTEQDPIVKEFEQAASKISRKHKFPWPINRQKYSNATSSMRSTTTSTNEQGESFYKLFDKNDVLESVGIKPIMSAENIKTTTAKRKPHKHHLRTKEPVLKSTIDGLTSTLWTKKPKPTPKLPTWLSHIFSTIIPKTTNKKIDYSFETMVPMMTTRRTTELSYLGERDGEEGEGGEEQNKPINSDKFNITEKPIWVVPERGNNYISQNQGAREGNYAGINSGQSLNGVGANNGQAGIIIGENSGIGRKPHNRPMLAKPIASYAYKPLLDE